MAVTLVGEVVNSGDTITGFNVGNISGDDDFVQGVAAIGIKASATTLEMYTTTLGVTAPYDFSATGAEFGHHIIMWFNSKSPIDATAGFRIVVGDGTSRGHWNVTPTGFYKGGFTTAVVNSARNFNSIAAGTWVTSSNPAQLTAITTIGGVIQTPASIMGSFNNFQLDQFTVGKGVRAEGGTVGIPNTFETVRAADENGGLWGWWSSKNGQIVGKGKLYIGPLTGSSQSVFVSSAESIVFASERVATDFYEIQTAGNATTASFALISLAAATGSAPWSLHVSSSTHSFSDTNGVWKGANIIRLSTNAVLDGTTLVDCTKLYQSGSTIGAAAILDANTTTANAFIVSDDPSKISNTSFIYSAGHAIEVVVAGEYTFAGNTFTGYGANASNDAAIFNNSAGLLTLNITNGGSTPTVRNGTNASTVINSNVSVTLTGLQNPSEVRVFAEGTTTELAGQEDVVTGEFIFSIGAGTAVDIAILALGYQNMRILNYSTATDASLPISQQIDRQYNNP